jgi:PAS domain S-box-containing protein
MIGRTPFDRMPPAARERALAAFTGMARDPGGFSGLEVTSLDGWGNLVSLEIGGVPFFGADGSLLGYRGVTRDVTLRKRAEEGLRESEERLRLAQEAAGIAIWDRNAATDRVTVAPGFIQRYLLEPEAMATYEDWIRYVHPDDREWLESARRAAFAAGGPLDLEFRIVIPSGEVRWIQLKARGVTERGGALGRVLGVIIDVTDRKRAEEALAESEADARSFFENMVDACAICEMVVDERGEPADIRLVDVNPAFERTLGLPARLIVGQTAFMILPTLHREWLDLFVEVGREGGFVEVEEPFPALDRRFHVTGFPVRDGRVAVVFRDVTGI